MVASKARRDRERVAEKMMEKDDAADCQYAEEAVMFRPIVQNRLLLSDRKAYWIGGRDFPAVVNRTRARVELPLPASVPTTPAPVDVVPVHEETLVQKSDGIKGFAAHH